MRRKKTPRQIAVDKADKLFSELIRRKYANEMGDVECYTCGKKANWYGDGMQCGHFITRGCYELRWDERNARVQCYSCNVINKGKYIKYYPKMLKEIGTRKVRELEKIRDRTSKPFTLPMIEGIIDDLQTKLDGLKTI